MYNDLTDAQLKRKRNQFKNIVSKNCISLIEEKDYKIYEYSNGQKFKCRGYLSDSVPITITFAVRSKKLF